MQTVLCHTSFPLLLQLYEVSADTKFVKPSDAACDVACFIYDLRDPRSFSYCASLYKVAGRGPVGLQPSCGSPTSPRARSLTPRWGFSLSLQQHYMDSQIPCVFVASKTDLPEASQQPGLSPTEFCYKHCLPPPFLFSCHGQGPPGTTVYTKLATAATFPLVSFPRRGLSTGSRAWGRRGGLCLNPASAAFAFGLVSL